MGSEEECEESEQKSVSGLQIRRTLAISGDDEQLLFEQQALCDDGSGTARSEDSCQRGEQMDKK